MKSLLKISLFVAFTCLISFYCQACDSTLTTRYPNGNKSTVKKYDNGLPCGKWHYYNENKRLLRREKYKKGKLVFTWIYNEEGRIAETINKKGKHKKFTPCNCK